MLILSLTTDKISLITSSATLLDVVACFTDRNQTTGAVGASDKQLTAISTAATTDIVGVPGATTTRNIKTLHINNKNTSNGNNTITVQLNANGTLYELYKCLLDAGECLEYIEGVGFYKLPNQVNERLLDRTFVTTSDQVFATTGTFVNITGLTCPVTPEGFRRGRRYNFEAHLYHIPNAATSGAGFGVMGGTAAFDAGAFFGIDCIAGTANTAGTLATGFISSANNLIIPETASSVVVLHQILSGFFVPPNTGEATGLFAVRANPEVTVANSLTVKRGSWLHLWEQKRIGS